MNWSNQDDAAQQEIRHYRAFARQRILFPLQGDVPQFGDPMIVDGYWEGRFMDTTIGQISKHRFYLVKFDGEKHPDSFRTYTMPTIYRTKWYVADLAGLDLAQVFETKKEAAFHGGGTVRGASIIEDPQWWSSLYVEFFL